MSDLPDKNTFASLYSGQAPWDIGRPQKALLDVAEKIGGSLLDAGCCTGENALFFAGRGHKVTGIDFLEEPIQRAKRKAAEKGLPVTLLVKDATTLKGWSEQFDNVIDCGLFHVFSDDDRKKYVDGLAAVLKPGGLLFLLCFSDGEGGRRAEESASEAVTVRGRARFEGRTLDAGGISAGKTDCQGTCLSGTLQVGAACSRFSEAQLNSREALRPFVSCVVHVGIHRDSRHLLCRIRA